MQSLFALVLLLAFGNMQNSPPLLDQERHWNSLLSTEALNLLPDAARNQRIVVIRKPEAWQRFWQVWHPELQLPPVNFETEHVVLVKNVRYLNRIHVDAIERVQNELRLSIRETRSARPIRNQVNCAAFVVARDAVQSISDGRTRITLGPLETGPSDQQ